MTPANDTEPTPYQARMPRTALQKSAALAAELMRNEEAQHMDPHTIARFRKDIAADLEELERIAGSVLPAPADVTPMLVELHRGRVAMDECTRKWMPHEKPTGGYASVEHEAEWREAIRQHDRAIKALEQYAARMVAL